jgi:myo-inositol-1(or 4)-monophosphatase
LIDIVIRINDSLLNKVEDSVVRAGSLVRKAFLSDSCSLTNHHKNGFVTHVDLESEKYLISSLHDILPEAFILSEESYPQYTADNGYCWVIDPLDGTVNFFKKIPFFCISVALMHNEVPVLGVIYDPMRQELFSAYGGGGIYFNGKVMEIKKWCEQNITVVAISLFCSSKIITVAKREIEGLRLRSLGAIALELAYVALGRIDGVIVHRAHWWDLAAGVVLVQEAGKMASSFEGKFIHGPARKIVASNSRIHSSLLRAVHG